MLNFFFSKIENAAPFSMVRNAPFVPYKKSTISYKKERKE
jgi:hypothetical protein